MRPSSSPARNEGVRLLTEADLAREIRDLRAEIRQMKELIDLLVALVVESDDIDEEEPGLVLAGGAEIPRLNN
ncbi:MAG: hypothetical protein AB9819_06890 [Methanomassiliicoccales archaeon]